MIVLEPIDIKLIKFYYDLKPNEKPDLWGFMLNQNPDFQNGTNGNKVIRNAKDKAYQNLKNRVKRLKRAIVRIDTLNFSRRKIQGKNKPCFEIKIDEGWHIFEITNELGVILDFN